MSYILDALRRSQAERERERGQVPGLDAQPVVPEETMPQRRVPPAVWLGLGLALGLVAALTAVLMRPAAPAAGAPEGSGAAAGALPSRPVVVQAPVAAGQVSAPNAAAPAPMAVGQGPSGQGPAADAAVAGQGLPVVVSAPPVPAPAQPRAPGQAQVPAATPSPAVPRSLAATSPPPAPPVAAAPAVATTPAPAAARVIPLAELPPDQKRELPPMTMGGSIWSENAANRFVIVNGQVVREGEQAATGVVVERIAQKGVILRWREMRIEVGL